MKKLITFLSIVLIVGALNAQDVTVNAQNFFVKSASGVDHFEFTTDLVADPELKIGKEFANLGPEVWMLNIQSTRLGPYVGLVGLETSTSGPNLWFHKARGASSTTPTSVVKGDQVGLLNFVAYNSDWQEVSKITSIVTNVSGSNVEAKLKLDATGGVDVNSSLALPVFLHAPQNTTYTVTETDHTIVSEAVGQTIQLPDPAGKVGRIYVIKKASVGGDTTIESLGTNVKIDGQSQLIINQAWQFVSLQAATPTAWIVIGSN